MSLGRVEAEARRGQGYVRLGRAGSMTDPVGVLQQASAAYLTAVKELPGAPAEDATALDKARYDKAKGLVDDLKNEMIAYARETANGLASSSARQASELAKVVRQEEHGKKAIGISYAKRPSASYAGNAIEKGKTYVSESLGRLDVIKQVLNEAKLLKPAEKQYMTEVGDRLNAASESIGKIKTQHEALASKAPPKAAKAVVKKSGKPKAGGRKADDLWHGV